VDAPGGLLGAAIDVTEPEPLTAEHPIWSHPRIMITPHLSGETEDELVASTTILLANVERVRAGKPHFNNVSFTKGY
jgi:phosphoglycerate dehydrogenase-like enzyme